ncbi:unnamed protein product [Medioppia subpectinata]|uniref:alpha-amylase n=1 Tax=Medioppia subpectinata TaxID=1979941 RepID=A0A7R9KJC0_9ACAR|nr:unnamed protein product [Medioppia subpectinata]CAG2103394.1 unnamed protein product [Medioppia subpectinata]
MIYYKMFIPVILSLVIAICAAPALITGSPFSDPHFKDNRSVIVHLMEWTYNEISKECELFLGPYGYGGVQVSPVTEVAVLPRRPWWERYQPVTYEINGRSGDEKAFADMVDTCNKVGVRIYVDVVLNHMTMAEQGVGTANHTYNGKEFKYDGVPYTHLDFHQHPACPTPGDNLNIRDDKYDDPIEARNCQLGGLRDLDQGRDWVRQKQAQLLNKLTSLGVAGFRLDAAKEMWPGDLHNITTRLTALNTKYFPAGSRPFIYNEFISGEKVKATEYTPLGRVIEFKNYDNLARVFRKLGDKRLSYLRNYGPGKQGWGMLPSDDALVFVDNHDVQRGHIGDITVTLTYFDARLLKMATAFMLAWPYAVPRIMSSYYWPRNVQKVNDQYKDLNDWMGPPHDSQDRIVGVQRMPDLSCDPKVWICEHRWRQIYNMVKFRNTAGFEPVFNWWENKYHSIAFSRGHKAFIAINNDDHPIDQQLNTGLPAGTYCDVISGNIVGLVIAICAAPALITGSPFSDPHFKDNRSVIVHLMEWTYAEVAKECELFLGPYGFGGVQLSPVTEVAVLDRRPWWERYQPVTYEINGRSGDEKAFADMVDRCNKVGVRIYVDVVLNHMTMAEEGKGTAGHTYNGKEFKYEVPYSYLDFHQHPACPTPGDNLDIRNDKYDDPIEARNCQLGGLRDLDQGKEWVRQKQVDFLNKMIAHGVAGFRSDASKHQWPQDLQNITARLTNLNTKYFPAGARPMLYHEYISGEKIKATEYTPLGRVIEFKNYDNLARVFRKLDGKMLSFVRNYGAGPQGWGMLPSDDSLVMVDSHDLQRGHTGDITVTLTYFDARLLKMATAFMLAWPYSIPRVMSSYYWPRNVQKVNDQYKDLNDWMGPPHDAHDNIVAVERKPDLSCDPKVWICEHRWRQIYNMVKFRNVAGFESVSNWWENKYNSIAFSRGNKAFIALNNDDHPIDQQLNTGLPAGTYCDVISGNIVGGKCEGRQVVVGTGGMAHIVVDNKWEDPMIAIHINAKL